MLSETKKKITVPKMSGLRERKRKNAREKIASAAIKLFIANGYEQTTFDEIAAFADVSKRGIFLHFATKEDIAFATQEQELIVLQQELDARPKNEPWTIAIENALDETAKKMLVAENLDMIKLIAKTPSLIGREKLRYTFFADIFETAIKERSNIGLNNPERAKLLAKIVAIEICTTFNKQILTCSCAKDIVKKIRIDFKRLWEDLRIFSEEGFRIYSEQCENLTS